MGVSPDSHETQCEFAEKMKVTFPMVGDSSGAIGRAFGVLGRRLFKDDQTKRVTFVIGPSGIVEGVFHHELLVWKHLGNVKELLERLR